MPMDTFAEGRRRDAPPLLEPGTLLDGHYEIASPLGEGGMAQVYLAFDRWLDRPVAIKLAHAAHPDQLQREAHVLASLQHPGIVVAHGYGFVGATPFLVLEYLRGVSLATCLANAAGGLDIDDALDLAVGICDAVQPLHDRGLVHGDLKPSNIMREETRVVVIDLGLVWEPAREPNGYHISGSPPFMAPEVIEHSVHPGQEQLIDVYAIGMILYSLIAGETAFADNDVQTTMQRQLLEPARPLSAHREGLPPRLSLLVDSMIDRSPSRRPQTLRRVRDALVGIPRRASPRVPRREVG